MANANNNTADNFNDIFDESDSLETEFDLQEYVRIVRKHKWLICLFTATITVLSAYYAANVTPVFRATSTLLIESQQKGPVTVEGWVGLDTDAGGYYETQLELLKSRELAQRVVRHLDLVNHPEFGGTSTKLGDATTVLPSPSQSVVESPQNPLIASTQELFNGVVSALKGGDTPVIDPPASGDGVVTVTSSVISDANQAVSSISYQTPVAQSASASDRESGAISQFLGRLSVFPVKRTKLVKISFESIDPEFAARVANTVGEQFIFAYLDSQMESSNKLSAWTNEQLVRLKTDLDQAEGRVIEYKQANGLIDVNGSVSRLNEQEMSLYTNELATVRSDLSDAEDLRREVRSYNGNIALLESIPAVQADPVVRGIKIDMGQQQRQLDELSNRYGAKHPRIVDAKSRMDSLSVNLQDNVLRVVSSIEKDYTLLRQRVASVQAKLDQGKNDIQALSVKNFELADLEREVLSKQTVYQHFFNRVTEANSTDGLQSANARIADFAIAPNFAFKPKKQLIVAIGALAALALSILMAFLYEQLDDTVKNLNDVERKLGLPMLGLIPLLKKGFFSGKKDAPINPSAIKDENGTFFESVKTIRTAIVMQESKSQSNEVIIVTSSVPGEGKSTTALNIAMSFSQIEKVLLIDADLRRPTIAKAMGLERDALGLTSLLTRTGSVKECIRVKAMEELDILCSGPNPDQPLELLSSNRFANLIEQLRNHYDRIIIDCPPAQAVSDPLVLSELADSVVYCIKSGFTSFQLADRGLKRLKQVGANISGIVMTQVDVVKLASYGGDYYYQGYYDYYGYNEKGELGGGKLKISPTELDEMNNSDSDYDFGFERKSDRQMNSNVITDNEFDLTMQFDTFEKKSRPSRNRGRLASDDLDIL